MLPADTDPSVTGHLAAKDVVQSIRLLFDDGEGSVALTKCLARVSADYGRVPFIVVSPEIRHKYGKRAMYFARKFYVSSLFRQPFVTDGYEWVLEYEWPDWLNEPNKVWRFISRYPVDESQANSR